MKVLVDVYMQWLLVVQPIACTVTCASFICLIMVMSLRMAELMITVSLWSYKIIEDGGVQFSKLFVHVYNNLEVNLKNLV